MSWGPEVVQWAAAQAQADQPPPVPPKRTALATDDPEKRPCKYCGHTQTDHMGPRCRGGVAGVSYSRSSNGIDWTSDPSPTSVHITMPSSTCTCTVYAPKED